MTLASVGRVLSIGFRRRHGKPVAFFNARLSGRIRLTAKRQHMLMSRILYPGPLPRPPPRFLPNVLVSFLKLEDGLRLVVRNENAPATANLPSTSDGVSAVSAAAERSPAELSGGQQALLGLALVLALSSYQAPPLCLLDEVDAALDETNQVRYSSTARSV